MHIAIAKGASGIMVMVFPGFGSITSFTVQSRRFDSVSTHPDRENQDTVRSLFREYLLIQSLKCRLLQPCPERLTMMIPSLEPTRIMP